MSKIDGRYSRYLSYILGQGYDYEDPNRKGVIRKEIPSLMFRHDLKDGFPILSIKKTFFKGAVAELLFFLSGSTDIRDLWRRGVNFWDKDWAGFHGIDKEQVYYLKLHAKTPDGYKSGDEPEYTMGKIYPAQYRDWNGQIDQFANVVRTLWKNPMSTSMIVNAWNPSDLSNMALPPCHYGFQIVGRPLSFREREEIFNEEKRFLMIDGENIEEAYTKEFDRHNIPKYGFEIHWQQRSTDYFLGSPINIQYYALLAILLEVITGHKALAIQGDMKNVHLYSNQLEATEELIGRDVEKYDNSDIVLSNYLKRIRSEGHYDGTNLDEILEGIQVEDFTLDHYKSFPRLKVDMLARDTE